MLALRPLAAILAVACTFLLAPAAAEARRSAPPMVKKINKVRKAYGVRPARYSPSLAHSSSRFAHYLARTNQIAHGSPIRASSRFSKLGEILAWVPGRRLRRSRTIRWWLLSPSHRAVLLSPAYRYVGAGRARRGAGGARAVFWTVQFGR